MYIELDIIMEIMIHNYIEKRQCFADIMANNILVFMKTGEATI